MPRKKKAPAATDDQLADPATDLAPPEQAAVPDQPNGWQWPESTEKRTLLVKWNDSDRDAANKRFSSLRGQQQDVKAEAKADAALHKSNLETIETHMDRLKFAIDLGGEERGVECRWHFETAGLDDTGFLIFHPEMKTLVRADTGETVSVIEITDADRQASLNLPDGELSEEDCEAVLLESGYGLIVNEDPVEDEAAFWIAALNDPDIREDIEGDNRLSALRNAVKMLRARADAEHVEAAVNSASTHEFNTRPDDTGTEAMRDGLRSEGDICRQNYGKNSRNRCPYPTGSESAQFWKGGWDAADDRINRELEAPKPAADAA